MNKSARAAYRKAEAALQDIIDDIEARLIQPARAVGCVF